MADHPHSDEQQPDSCCLDDVAASAGRSDGLVEVSLDTAAARLKATFDATVVDDEASRAATRRMAEPIGARFATCSFHVDGHGGRGCESCAAALERRLVGVEGVRHASVSYRGGLLRIVYDRKKTSPDRLITQVANLRTTGDVPSHAGRFSGWRAVWLEGTFTFVTLVAMIAGFLLGRAGLDSAAAAMYLVAYGTGGYFGVRASIESLRNRVVDIDLLMVLAALGAAAVGAPFEGAMLLFLFSLSNLLQEYAMGRTRTAINELMTLRPTTAVVRRGGNLATVPIEQCAVGEVFVLKPGDRLPLDGVVVAGEGAVDQSTVTGESMPVHKTTGSEVFAGTINSTGSLEVRITRPAADSTIEKLIKMVEEAQSEKAKTQRFIDRAEQYYAAGVIVMTIVAIGLPILLLAEAFDAAFYRAMTLMVAASPCALVISTPATILSAIGNGARRGVLFKGGAHVEQAASVKVVAFDKTGTLTEGRPEVTDVLAISGIRWQGSEDDLLALAASVQAKSEHALAAATVRAAQTRGLTVAEASAFQASAGKGVQGTVGGLQVMIGNLRYFEGQRCTNMPAARQLVEMLQAEAKTSVIVALVHEDRLTAIGVIAYADRLRAGAAAVVRDLKALGVEHVVMLTGDNDAVAERIAADAGIDEYYAEMMPDDKMRMLKDLARRYGPVAMVGDGVNDAPALAAASIGIAMGAAGSDVALETADVVLMSDDLSRVPYLVALSRRTRRTLVANLSFAMAMIVMMIAAILVIDLPLPLAVIGHEGSTVLVSLNGLRMLGFRH
jgi:Zn2+/Cd2+-exporting ATPase